ncbi:AAA family ATPase [Christiangramia forsetii]|uniref:Anticodon nuclease n=2 Tax=Christiangramia forsetii TaxID=411153 RepID=A0LZ60_CHRFK|nr:AAA family ATPase [Christiangramia forsetii]GGG37530.1 anticodon nuclease [Christiangramia forsetii]CAL65655.1 anticodon nuclease [Christiangramia forsetii KT0803]
MKNSKEIAKELYELEHKICLIYAFNATGKTQLSVGYKNYTKAQNGGRHTGVYYNAYSEDLFVWDNDEEHQNENVKLGIKGSSLNTHHSLLLDTPILIEKLSLYNPNYIFELNLYEDGNREKGIASISFYEDENKGIPIKISRGQEKIFIWCFYLALFDVETFTGDGEQDAHLFIDDPVSSMDENNIYLTTESIINLIDGVFPNKKVIITTHHIGLFSILANRFTKGEKSKIFESQTKTYLLQKDINTGELSLNEKNGVFLFHLHLLKTLEDAINDELFVYHFALLRQLLEHIASFLGRPRIGYVLNQIGMEDASMVSDKINSLSHQDVYRTKSNLMSDKDIPLFEEIFSKIIEKYRFKY